MLEIVLKKVSIDAVESLRELSIKTFVETYASFNTEENMELYIREDLSIASLSHQILEPSTEFFFALHQNKPIGFLKINHLSAENTNPGEKGIEIERIYVLKEFQGMKIGHRLYAKVEAIAGNNNYDYIWLGVWEHNSNARKFYERIGFTPFGEHVFKLGEDSQRDILMRKGV